jgi:hypothetical protein
MMTMSDFSPFESDVLLKGTLTVRAVGRHDGRPQRGKQVLVSACGYG